MDHYETLGVSPNASDAVILAAYRQRLKEVHPDTGNGDNTQMNAIKRAGAVLLSASDRAEYDAGLASPLGDGDAEPAAGGLSNRHIALGVIAVGLVAITIALFSCSATTADDRAASIAFVDVSTADTWSDVLERVADCGDRDTTQAGIDHLKSANPVVAAAGLSQAAVIAFDPAEITRTGCALRDRPAEAQDQPNSSADADETQPAPVAAAVDDDAHDDDAHDDAPTTDDSVAAAAPADDAATQAAAIEPPPPPQTPSSEAFFEEFLEESSLDRFRWQIHHAMPFHGTPESWQGDHDLDCGPPPTLRTVNLPPPGTDPGEAVYWCAPGGPATAHMMTTFRTGGYAQVGFMPDQLFSQVTRVCWDQNQTDLGSRKWTQLVVVDEATFVANDQRLDYVSPRLEAGPGDGGVFLSEDVFLFEMLQGSTVTHLGRTITEEDFRGFTTTDKKRRYRTCIEDLEDGTVSIELERETDTEVRIMAGAFPDGPARVIFQDDTYNSTKSPSPVEEPFTWHWDNISVETS